MDDDELIAAIAAGQDTALRELFRRHASWLAARLGSVLPPSDAEDVLQETFLAVWRGAGGYQAGSAGGWLWGIARRQAALLLRRRGLAELPLTGSFSDNSKMMVASNSMPGDSGDPAEAVVSAAVLAEAAATLGGPDREVWRLMYIEDRPVAEVAELLGIPAGTVKSRAHRVRRLLRAALGGPAARRGGPAAQGGAR